MSDVKLVVEVFRPSGILLPPGPSEEETERRGLMLLPGENAVTEQYWDFAKKNPAIKIALRGDCLKNNGKGKAKPIVNDWNAITLGKAEKVIAKIKDAGMLREVKSNAKKKGLRDLCDARIEMLLNETEADNADSND